MRIPPPTKTESSDATAGGLHHPYHLHPPALLRRYSAFWLFFALLMAGARYLTAEPARMADGFVDSIGVNTHFGMGGTYTVTTGSPIQIKLRDSGIRHIRDTVNDAWTTGISNVYNAYGIKTLLCKGGYNIISYLNDSYVEAAEGQNEPDGGGLSYNGVSDNASQLDFSGTRAYQFDLFAACPTAKPLISPAPGWTKNASALAHMRFDKIGFHPYPLGGWPGNGGLDSDHILDASLMTASGQSQRPLWATESGYHNAVSTTEPVHRPVTETASGKYIPRLLAGYFNRGIERTYLYQFADTGTSSTSIEENFGLVRNNLTEKPAYWAIKNLISLLNDQGNPFTPSALDYTLTTTATNLKRTLLQKRNGDFYLLLWQEAQSCDQTLRFDGQGNVIPVSNIYVPDVNVTVTFNRTVGSQVIYRDLDSGSCTTQNNSGQSLSLTVPDEVVLIQITGATTGCTTGIPAPAAYPDLVLTKVWTVPAEPKPGDTVTVKATVKNTADYNSGASTVTFYLDGAGSVNWTAPTSALNAGASVEVTANGTFIATAGYHTIRAYADGTGLIQEAGELNNHLTHAVPVVTSRYLDLCSTFGTNWTVTPDQYGATWTQTTINGQACFQNTSGTALGKISHPISPAISSNWKLDFDYDWQFGSATFGLYLYTDMLDGSGNGYRMTVHQGDTNNSANTFQQIEIHRMNAGVQGVRLGAGSGYDLAGWYPQAGPVFKHVRLIYDRATLSLSAYIDKNADGVFEQVIPPVRDSNGYTSFTNLVMHAWDSQGAACRPVLDNIQMDSGVLNMVPAPFFADAMNDLSKWTSVSNWAIGSANGETYAQNTTPASSGSMTRVIGPAISSDWTLSFDYDWIYGGDPGGGLYHGNHGLVVYADVLNDSNSGYRLVIHQGDNGDSTKASWITELFQMNAGVVGSRLACGGGYNERGWAAAGLNGPCYKRIAFTYNKTTQSLSVFVDTNHNGVMEQVIAPVQDSPGYTTFTKIVLSAAGSGSCTPQIDNVQLGLIP